MYFERKKKEGGQTSEPSRWHLFSLLSKLWMLTYDHKAHGALTRVTASKVEYMGVSIFSTGHWASGADFSLDHMCSPVVSPCKGRCHHWLLFWAHSPPLWLTAKSLGLWVIHLHVTALVCYINIFIMQFPATEGNLISLISKLLEDNSPKYWQHWPGWSWTQFSPVSWQAA